MKKIWLIGFLLIIALISGCAGPKTETQPAATASQTPPAQPVPATAVNIEIKGFAFNPATITIPKGTTVIWTQKDSAQHTATSAGNAFSSDILSQGQTFSYTFNESGTFEYNCHIHPSMRGKVIVS